MSTTGQRVNVLQTWIRTHGVDALLLTHLPDIRWAVGFTGSHAYLLVTSARAWLLTDGRYTTQAEQEVQGAEVQIVSGDVFAHIKEAGYLAELTHGCFQAEHLTVSAYRRLTEALEHMVWEGVEGLTHTWRGRKAPDELARLRRAQELTDRVFQELLGWIRPGYTEKEVAAEIVYRLLCYGAERMSFEPLVAAGSRSALPHARPSTRVLREGEPLLLDFGCVYEGYASDMTRMVYLGKAPEAYREHYRCVLQAQEAAIASAQADIPVKEVDMQAREHLKTCGLDAYFTHSLGHGVGLEIHEWPRVSYQSEDKLIEGAVITVEPGIYLPGKYGIRIEDMLHITATGSENLTSSTKELIELT